MKKNKPKHRSQYQLQKDRCRIISESYRIFLSEKIKRGIARKKLLGLNVNK